MTKPCDCKWYSPCTKKPGCTKRTQSAQVNATRPTYVPRPAPRTETVVGRTVETSYDSGPDLGTVIAIGMMIDSTPDVTVCPAPVYVAPEPVCYSPSPDPSPSYDSSSYSSSSDYSSSSSCDSSDYSSSSDW